MVHTVSAPPLALHLHGLRDRVGVLIDAGLHVLLWGPPGWGKTTLSGDLARRFDEVVNTTVWPGTDEATLIAGRVLAGTETPYELGPWARAAERAEAGGRVLLRIAEAQNMPTVCHQHLASLSGNQALHLPGGRTIHTGSRLTVILEANPPARIPDFMLDRLQRVELRPWPVEAIEAWMQTQGLGDPEAAAIARLVASHNDSEARTGGNKLISVRGLSAYCRLRAVGLGATQAAELGMLSHCDHREPFLTALQAVWPD